MSSKPLDVFAKATDAPVLAAAKRVFAAFALLKSKAEVAGSAMSAATRAAGLANIAAYGESTQADHWIAINTVKEVMIANWSLLTARPVPVLYNLDPAPTSREIAAAFGKMLDASSAVYDAVKLYMHAVSLESQAFAMDVMEEVAEGQTWTDLVAVTQTIEQLWSQVSGFDAPVIHWEA